MKMSAINIVFDGPPSECGRFVDVENDDGRSISIGDWIKRHDGYWVLRIEKLPNDDGKNEHRNR